MSLSRLDRIDSLHDAARFLELVVTQSLQYRRKDSTPEHAINNRLLQQFRRVIRGFLGYNFI